MTHYTDIATLDQDAFDIRGSWKVTINQATSFAVRFRAIDERFKSGEFSPEWTFARWLVAKCGMSLRTCYRVIQQLERTTTDDVKRRTQEALAEIRKQQAQEKAELRARKLAWNDWLLEEKNRKVATQVAWDEWLADAKAQKQAERARVKAEKEAKAAELHRQRSQRYRDRQKDGVTLVFEENEKPLPNVATVSLEMVLAELVALISAIPKADRLPAIRQVVGVLHELCDDIEDHGEAAGWVAGGIDLRH